jgi:hypothetical protein
VLGCPHTWNVMEKETQKMKVIVLLDPPEHELLKQIAKSEKRTLGQQLAKMATEILGERAKQPQEAAA